jgi:hypothetical protein
MSATGGTIRGMATTKTTLYLPEPLKRRIEREAKRKGLSEAEVIRRVLNAGLERPRRRGGFLHGEPIADRVDELLKGFGTR